MTPAPLIQHLDERGKLLSSFAYFLESADPDDIWMLSKILSEYEKQSFHVYDSTELFEAAILQIVSIQADHRQSEQGGPRDEFDSERFSGLNTINFILSALSMARNEKDEEVAAIYTKHREAFHDETVGYNRAPSDHPLESFVPKGGAS